MLQPNLIRFSKLSVSGGQVFLALLAVGALLSGGPANAEEKDFRVAQEMARTICGNSTEASTRIQESPSLAIPPIGRTAIPSTEGHRVPKAAATPTAPAPAARSASR